VTGADVHAAVMLDYNNEFDVVKTVVVPVTVTALTFDSATFITARKVTMLDILGYCIHQTDS